MAAPSMSIIPTEEDVRVYNLWAAGAGAAPWRGRVRGRDLLGAAPAVPAAPAAIPAPGRARRSSPAAPGPPAPPAHGRTDPTPAGGFRRGTIRENGVEYAIAAETGQRIKLRRWDAREQRYQVFQPAFDNYYSDNRQQFIIHVSHKNYVLPRGARDLRPAAADLANPNFNGDETDLPLVPQ